MSSARFDDEFYRNKILDSIGRGTKFRASVDAESRIDRKHGLGFISGEEVRAKIRCGEFNEGIDKYILQTIDEMGYCTITTLFARFRFLQRNNSKRRFGNYTSKKELETYLRFLCQNGLLHYIRYRTTSSPDAPLFFFYFVTEQGHAYYNGRLEISTFYSKDMVSDSVGKIFNTVRTNLVLSSFVGSMKCTDIKYGHSYQLPEGVRADMTKTPLSDFRRWVYGSSTITNENGLKHHYLVEPIRFLTDNRELTPEDMDNRVFERLMWMKAVVENEEQHAPTPNEVFFLLLLVEDMSALQRLSKIIKAINKDSFFETHALISCDETIVNGFMNDVGHAMLKVTFRYDATGKHLRPEYAPSFIDLEIPQAWIRLSEGTDKDPESENVTYV